MEYSIIKEVVILDEDGIGFVRYPPIKIRSLITNKANIKAAEYMVIQLMR